MSEILCVTLVMGKGREETGSLDRPRKSGGGRGRAGPPRWCGRPEAEQQEARRRRGPRVPSLRVTMRGAAQVSVMLLLVTASDCAVITGVSQLVFPGFGHVSGSARERARSRRAADRQPLSRAQDSHRQPAPH